MHAAKNDTQVYYFPVFGSPQFLQDEILFYKNLQVRKDRNRVFPWVQNFQTAYGHKLRP